MPHLNTGRSLWPTLVLDTAASTEPVTTAEAKKHFNEDLVDTANDTYIDTLIATARAYIENRTNRQLVTATWDQIYDVFPNHFQLRKPPLISVTSIVYLDVAGDSQTVSSSDYQVITSREPGEIWLAPSATWPATEDERLDAVTVKFQAGFGNAAAVPDSYKHAIKILANTWYENREEVVVGATVNEMKSTAAVDSIIRFLTIPELR